MIILEGIVLFCVLCVILWNFVPPIALNIIWYKRVKKGKSKRFGPLGIITIIVTVLSVFELPFTGSLILNLLGFT